MIDDAIVVLTHIPPDIMAYNADLVGPANTPVTHTSGLWNIWEWRWK